MRDRSTWKWSLASISVLMATVVTVFVYVSPGGLFASRGDETKIDEFYSAFVAVVNEDKESVASSDPELVSKFEDFETYLNSNWGKIENIEKLVFQSKSLAAIRIHQEKGSYDLTVSITEEGEIGTMSLQACAP